MKTPTQWPPSDEVAPSLRENTLWMLAGRFARIFVQAAYFVLLARSLGVAQYGAFVAAASLAGVLSPFASLGAGNLLIKHVARDRARFARSWGEALTTTTISGTLLSLMGILVGRLVLPKSVPVNVIVPLVFAELIFARLLDVAGLAYVAFEKLQQTAALLVALSVFRMLAAATLMALFRHPSASVWATLYLVSTAIPALGAIVMVNSQIGQPLLAFSSRPRELLQGLYFAITLSAQTIYNDIDKVMLARLAGLTPAGLYGAAYRIVDVAGTPLGAILAASYSRFFQHGAKGLRYSVRFARKLLPTTVLFGSVCSLSLTLAAPLLLPVLGRQYAETVTALRWLAPIVFLRCIHYIGADAMTGGDRQGLRSLIQVIVAIVNVILNLLVLPRYSWQGAIGTSLACDALLAVLIWCSIWRLSTGRYRISWDPVDRNNQGIEARS